MSEAAWATAVPGCDSPSPSERSHRLEAAEAPAEREQLLVALLLLRLVLEGYGDAGPNTTRVMAALDRVQAQFAKADTPALDRAATVALFKAVSKVRALVQ